MTRVAVLQFPGINSEYETLRALWDAGIQAEFFRWNQPASELNNYDGFVIPGGFSYEDRGRSGLIASMDPIMQEIRRQADRGKPVLGICNGAQIVVETGLVPGGPNHELWMSLARNKRVKDGKVLGVGFYNENIFVRCDAPHRTAFTLDYNGGEVECVPVAHGEGRFTTAISGLLETLQKNNQIVFRYSTKEGQVSPDFPVNPNGAMDNAAAICNPRGNVMAIMPHPERAPSAPMPKIFTSMRKYMEARQADPNFKLEGEAASLQFSYTEPAPELHSHKSQTVEFYVQLKITDNEAQTLENTLRQNGFEVRLRKWKYFEIESASQNGLAEKLYNSNKETLSNDLKKEGAQYFLVTDIEDVVGMKLSKELSLPVRHGIVWEVAGNFDTEKLLATHIFANPHAQKLLKLK